MRTVVVLAMLMLCLADMSRLSAQNAADPATPPEPRLALKLTYTFKDPTQKDAPGAWTKSDFKQDANWKPADSVVEIEAAMKKENASKVWFRFQSTSTKETYNNTYFASKHNGIIEVWNEGERNRWNIRNEGSSWQRYFGFIYRRTSWIRLASTG